MTQIIEKKWFEKSKNSSYQVFTRCWIPKNQQEISGAIQLVHGMHENTERYQQFAQFLVSKNFAVYQMDLLGHGKTGEKNENFGFFGHPDGWQNILEDIYALNKTIRKNHPEKKLTLFGHSMGSFLVREYCSNAKMQQSIDLAVFCGSMGKSAQIELVSKIANFQSNIKGPQSPGKFIQKVTGFSSNKKFKSEGKNGWLTKDVAIQNSFQNDRFTKFFFSASSYYQMFSAVTKISGENWAIKIQKNLPILIVSGAMDSVGNFGKGPKEIYNWLKNTNHTNVSLKLFENDRHEVLNETDKNQVYNEIFDFISSYTKTQK